MPVNSGTGVRWELNDLDYYILNKDETFQWWPSSLPQLDANVQNVFNWTNVLLNTCWDSGQQYYVYSSMSLYKVLSSHARPSPCVTWWMSLQQNSVCVYVWVFSVFVRVCVFECVNLYLCVRGRVYACEGEKGPVGERKWGEGVSRGRSRKPCLGHTCSQKQEAEMVALHFCSGVGTEDDPVYALMCACVCVCITFTWVLFPCVFDVILSVFMFPANVMYKGLVWWLRHIFSPGVVIIKEKDLKYLVGIFI